MPHGVTIGSLPAAFEMMKAMQVDDLQFEDTILIVCAKSMVSPN